MATVSSPLPPPVKNDWLPSGLDNPRLSPPSPGGPRKPAPTSQVKYKNRKLNLKSSLLTRFNLLGPRNGQGKNLIRLLI